MELSSVFLIILVGVSIGAIILYYTLKLRPSSVKVLNSGDGSESGSLSTPTVLGTAQIVTDNFFSTPASTLDGYFYLNGRVSNIDSTIIAIGDILQLKLKAAGPGGNPETVLVIKHAGKPTGEEIKCADFPMQKYVYLTIIREGRRFTVFYNDQVAADARVSNPINTVITNITVGSQGLPGEWALVNMSPYAYRLDDIRIKMDLTSNTRRVPYVTPTLSLDFLSCPNGFFCFGANTSQQSTLSPLRRWQTQYA
jgi:hypothetical protein